MASQSACLCNIFFELICRPLNYGPPREKRGERKGLGSRNQIYIYIYNVDWEKKKALKKRKLLVCPTTIVKNHCVGQNEVYLERLVLESGGMQCMALRDWVVVAFSSNGYDLTAHQGLLQTLWLGGIIVLQGTTITNLCILPLYLGH